MLNLPIAHGEGSYVADAETLRELNLHRQILLRYCDANGATTDAANPNGSAENIAGICNDDAQCLRPHATPRAGV